ncbi:glycosyltransferase family 39 protein [Hymenobacter tibetensis]|uniref:Glycosyltransferase family 39 protein n=1 Tax=Hymenobacter tibetensis TaxID=497967 RepID=A0ABY4D3N6_9BACT|nr:glycosyltransferase family 39 protein [Hymenobacter tibetensis]UOG76906.1 glycosyltransferase family 39 protein [Hymenobacter tibetensis]
MASATVALQRDPNSKHVLKRRRFLVAASCCSSYFATFVGVNHRWLFRLPTVALGLVFVFTVAFFAVTHEGLYDIDDHFYARYAHALATGTYRPLPDPQHLLHDPLQERLLVFGPVAGLYRLFGINIISTTLWPLLCTLGCALVVWALYRRREPVVAAGAMLLLGLHYFTLNLSTYLYPDNVLMFCCTASAAALVVGRRLAQARPVAWGVGFALLNFAALLSKETIVFYLPFYVALLSLDAYRRRHSRFWVAALAAGSTLLAAYLVYFQVLTHDPLYRYHIIEQTNAFMRDGNYVQGHRGALLGRVTWEPLLFFVGTGMGVMLVLAAATLPIRGAALRRSTTVQAPADDASFWLALAVSTLAFYWWGSTSLQEYNPISLQPRMVTPLLPPLAIAAGFGLRAFWQTGRRGWFIGGMLLLFAGWLRSSVSVPYGLLGFFFLALALFRTKWPTSYPPRTAGLAALLLGGLAAALLLRPLYFMGKPTVSSHFAQSRVLQTYLAAPARGVVYVDEFLLRNHDFHYGFHVPPTLRFRSYLSRDSVRQRPGEKVWLLLNRSTLTNEELTRRLIRYSPDSVLAWFPHRKLVAQDGKVELYEVGK